MQEKKVYEYAFIRIVPQVEREEFINTGVILYCKGARFLAMKHYLDRDRLKIFSQKLNPDELDRYLDAWQRICQGSKTGGRIAQLDHASRFRWLIATKSTVIQCSPVHPGLCTDPKAKIETLFESYVK